MNTNRKAELQRKLSMTPVARPPADLAGRIKAGIPSDLGTQPVRRGSLLRLAASLTIVGLTALIAAHYFTPAQRSKPFAATPFPRMIEKKDVAPAELAKAPVAAVETTVSDAPAVPRAAPVAADAAPAPAKPKAPSEPAPLLAGGSAPEPIAEPLAEPALHAEGAPRPDAAAEDRLAQREAVNEPTALRASAPGAERVTVSVAVPPAPGLRVLKASAVPVAASFAAPREIFGISVDPDAFGRVQRSIENGERPATGSVDVQAIINYFAGGPQPPSSAVRFEVEGSQPPAATAASPMIRFTIDTPADSREASVGRDAVLDVSFSEAAVASHRVLGNGGPLSTTEPLLFDNASITAVIEVQLNRGISPHEEVARLRLRYHEAGGREHVLLRVVRANELQRSWAVASTRHRIATLAALWSESLQSGTPERELAGLAERLAAEAPGDARARELAETAAAATKVRGSGSVGSSR